MWGGYYSSGTSPVIPPQILTQVPPSPNAQKRQAGDAPSGTVPPVIVPITPSTSAASSLPPSTPSEPNAAAGIVPTGYDEQESYSQAPKQVPQQQPNMFGHMAHHQPQQQFGWPQAPQQGNVMMGMQGQYPMAGYQGQFITPNPQAAMLPITPLMGGLSLGGPTQLPMQTPMVQGMNIGVQYQPGIAMPQPQPQRGQQNRMEDVTKISKWLPGPHYGPVLDTSYAMLVEAQFEINPLLKPHPETSKEPRIEYNILFPPSSAHLSTDPPKQSWANRKQPFCIPRLNEIFLVSPFFSDVIPVQAHNPEVGVTCGEVLDTIHNSMAKVVSKKDYAAISVFDQAKINTIYHHNRSTEPGAPGGILGTGVLRADLLKEYTLFGGIQNDPEFVQRKLGLRSSGDPKKDKALKARKIAGFFVLDFEHNRGGKDVEVPAAAVQQAQEKAKKASNSNPVPAFASPPGSGLTSPVVPQGVSPQGQFGGMGYFPPQGIPQGIPQGMQQGMPQGMPYGVQQQGAFIPSPYPQYQPMMPSPMMGGMQMGGATPFLGAQGGGGLPFMAGMGTPYVQGMGVPPATPYAGGGVIPAAGGGGGGGPGGNFVFQSVNEQQASKHKKKNSWNPFRGG